MDINFFKNLNGYEIEGLWYPRVTAIVKVIAKPGLERWLAKQGSVAAMEEKRKKITGFGHLVHDTIEKILMGEAPQVDSLILPSVEAVSRWLAAHRVRVLDVERRVVSRQHFYAGNIDVLAEIDGRFGIVDIKTGAQFWDDYFIQTSAYFQAHNEGDIKKAETHWILRVDQYQECKECGAVKRQKGGEYEIKGGYLSCPHQWSELKGVCELQEVDDHPTYIEIFLTAKKLWEMINREQLAQIENYAGKRIV
jgi:hypothetical protein